MANAETNRESNYVTNARRYARELWAAYLGLVGLQAEWNAMNYASTLNTFEGENEGLVATDIGSVVFDTADALAALMTAGHAANVAKLL